MGARELLHDLGAAGFSVRVVDDTVLVKPASRLNDEMRAAIRSAKPELLHLLARPHKLTAAEADDAHRDPWTEEDIARFSTRVLLFIRRGVSATDADDLAERMHLHDVQGDGRRLCLECRHLHGRGCANSAAAGVGHDLPAELLTRPQRCSGFVEQ